MWRRAKASKLRTSLLPGIATCRTCHNGGTQSAESRCFECHTYHDPSQRKFAPGQFALPDLLQSMARDRAENSLLAAYKLNSRNRVN